MVPSVDCASAGLVWLNRMISAMVSDVGAPDRFVRNPLHQSQTADVDAMLPSCGETADL